LLETTVCDAGGTVTVTGSPNPDSVEVAWTAPLAEPELPATVVRTRWM
jgi:hypothetical protein